MTNAVFNKKDRMETEADSLDRLILILEISFIFLLSFTIIALVDAAFEGLNLYHPLAEEYLGQPNVGDLRGGNFEEIVRITFVLNGLLFVSSLIFGVWIRRVRDGWTWADLGYTLKTPNFTFYDLMKRGMALGILSILIFYFFMVPAFYLEFGKEGYLAIFAYSTENRLFTPKELNASYYFGIVEMGFIWPLSAGFFFFSYTYTSLKSKFPVGIANILATLFYVFYLIFFFLIPNRNKVSMFRAILFDPKSIEGFSPILFWSQVIVFLIVLYINFSSFEQTGSIVLPFTMNFVFNVGLTLIRAGNTLAFEELEMLMWLPVILLAIIAGVWWSISKKDFSTVRLAVLQLQQYKGIDLREFLISFLTFITLSFFLPGLVYELLFLNNREELARWVIPTVFAIELGILLLFSFVVLTYLPSKSHDVLLLTKDGLPLASYLDKFETDEFLISGFFTAISSVDFELSEGKERLSTIKRGNKEILVEEGVNTRLIVMVDRDIPSLRQKIVEAYRKFEIQAAGQDLGTMIASGNKFQPVQDLVETIHSLETRFDIPQPIRWAVTVSMVIGPFMVLLNGLL